MARRASQPKVVLVPILMAMVHIPLVFLWFSCDFSAVFLWHPGQEVAWGPIPVATLPVSMVCP